MTKRVTEASKKMTLAVVQKMVALSTAGFGLVAALSWNNVIKELIEQYIKPLIGGDSGIISLVIYAVIVTGLAVSVTMWLTRIEERLK